MAVTTVLLGTFTINASESRITSDSRIPLFACLQNTGFQSLVLLVRQIDVSVIQTSLCMFGKPKFLTFCGRLFLS